MLVGALLVGDNIAEVELLAAMLLELPNVAAVPDVEADVLDDINVEEETPNEA